MRPQQLRQLFNWQRLRKLRNDFQTPWRALAAASGAFRQTFKLITRKGETLRVDRSDLPAWDAYFQPQSCHIEIAGNRFHVIPHDPKLAPYHISGAHNLMTSQPRRWNTTAWRSPLVKQLELAERSVFSQHGEDGILEALLQKIPTPHKFVVEFGAYDGELMSNSRNLILHHHWSALLIEASPRQYSRLQQRYRDNPRIKTLQSFVTVDNINQLFTDAGVPRDFEVLSIDVDSIDYYLWEALTQFEPRIVIIEYNSSITPEQHYVVPAADAFRLSGTSAEGASIRALYELGKRKGYTLVYTELYGANLFFLHHSCLQHIDTVELTPAELYQPPQFGVLAGGRAPNGRGYS